MSSRYISAAIAAVVVAGFPAAASAATYVLHVGGVCSDHFVEGTGYLTDFPDIAEVDAWVNQQNNMTQATNDLVARLDQYCRNGNACYVYTYSNGGAVLSRALSLYGNGQWNVVLAVNSASNEGGSELSDIGGGTADAFGSCDLIADIGVSDHRNGWNHHDTDGVLFYMSAGSKESWTTDWALPGDDDGTVAMHSAGGYSWAGSFGDACRGGYWDFHVPFEWAGARYCEFGKDHGAMKMHTMQCISQGC